MSRKDDLLEKARNRTITYEESNELRNILEQEAKNAKAVGDLIGFFIIMGLILFLGALVTDLFGGKG